jgi:tetratricopeptide (TPR) repeat protein
VGPNARYTLTITPQAPAPVTPKQTTAIVIFWLTIIAAIAGIGGAWSNHFQSGFHLNDFRAIVTNPAIRTLTNIPKFFVDPGLFSSARAQAAYAPLVSMAFAVDYAVRGHADALMFQFQIFVWFCFELGFIYLLLRLIPGGRHYSALFGMALFALHPIAANTLNDPLQLGVVIGSVGLLAGLSFALVWPQRLPPALRLGAPKVPKSEWDLFRLKSQPKVNRWYPKLRATRLGLYMIPVGFGLLAFPGTAIFAPLLALYMVMFEPEKSVRRVRYAAGICGGYWLIQAIATWSYTTNVRSPLVAYWATQPLVVLRSLYFFFFPFHVGGVSTLQPVEHLWSPWALAGYATTAALIMLALLLTRLPDWRAVAFGLWWFLIALAPFALLPQQQVEAFPRMFFASLGLVLAVSRTALIVGNALGEAKSGDFSLRIPVLGAGLVLAISVLSLYGQETYQLNDIWRSDETLWKDMAAKHADDGIALARYGFVLANDTNPDFFDIRLDIAYADLKQAVALLPNNPEALTSLAQASQLKRLDTDAGDQLRKAIQVGPSYAPAYALYARWLLDRGKATEAIAMAQKAIQLDSSDLVAWQAMADIYLTKPDWKNAIEASRHVVQLDPDSADGLRSLQVAQSGVSVRETAETVAVKQPSVENYLSLSVVYYNEKRYEDCIREARAALKLQPDVAEAWVNIATAYHQLGNTAEGISALREATRLRPDLEVARMNLAWEVAHLNDHGNN